tara:strand:- start:51539 stop:52048 length:510 start_codon:yes stop_codon:yes gene_type:complete
MIYVALGANLPNEHFGAPERTLPLVADYLDGNDINVKLRSRLYRSAPVPLTDDPWFINAVIGITSTLSPMLLLIRLLETEEKFGRKRSRQNDPRSLDLDLLDYDGIILDEYDADRDIHLDLPHPRMFNRSFVLLPLVEIAPEWRHPVSKIAISELIKDLGEFKDISVLS